MKLDIGENIKKLRKTNNITQEQLAEKLGVSSQSVSRWEKGVCYPDMELLPEIAGVFDVTTDVLLKTDELKKFRQYESLMKDLDTACADDDVGTIMDILQEVRNNHIVRLNYWFFEALSKREIYIHCEILNEVKSFMKHLIENSKESHIVEASQRLMNILEGDVITIYSTTDPSRREPDENEKERRRLVYKDVSAVLFGDWRYRTVDYPIPQYWLWQARLKLDFLNSFCYQRPRTQYVVSGNGEPDIFFVQRVWLGMDYACYLSVLYDHEKAFAVLEDTVSLLEKVMALPDGTELTSTSPVLDGLKTTVRNVMLVCNIITVSDSDESDKTNENKVGGKGIVIGADKNIGIWCESIYYYLINAQWFEPIRKDSRYQGYVERIKALAVTRDGNAL